MTAPPRRYCLDTSAWLDGWRRYYPITTFPSLWHRVGDLILAGRLFWTEEVAAEILDDDLLDWLAPHSASVVATAAIWSSAQAIQQQFNAELHEKGIVGADAFVIAAAQVHSLLVVTGEKRSAGRPKMPDVCDRLDIQHMSFLRMIQREGWTF